MARHIIQRHLDCPSMLCVIALQDWLAIDEHLRLKDANAERINIPANPRHYWRYRMHLNIEDLKNDKSFTEGIREMIVKGNRV
jgi:4-alpha-glucanotransferase